MLLEALEQREDNVVVFMDHKISGKIENRTYAGKIDYLIGAFSMYCIEYILIICIHIIA